MSLWWSLLRETGWRHTLLLSALALLTSVVDVAGLGLAATLLLGSGDRSSLPLNMPSLPLSLQGLLTLLVVLMALRGLLQVGIAWLQEWLRSALTDRLRLDLLRRVLYASSLRLDRVGRGELLGLLMADISRSVLALDQGLRAMQNLMATLIYMAGVLLVGRGQAGALVLGLVAAGLAGLLQRSGAWRLGQLQSRLNGSLQRTVGDGLHGLKAIRAAGAEPWLLERFAAEAQAFRCNLRLTMRRQSVFTALRDWLVVLVVALWLGLGGARMEPAAVATLLVMAYRAAGSFGGLISSRRLCLGALPGYGALRELRCRLGEPVLDRQAVSPLRPDAVLKQVRWQGEDTAPVLLRRGGLAMVVGPSGSGKSTLLDRVAGLLAEEQSHWHLEATGQPPLVLGGSGEAAVWRELVAYAPQGAVLLEGSLAENLLLGREPSDRDGLLIPWMEQLGLEHLLLRPGGLDRPLNLAIDCLSGGEIQRLGLLRAWLMDRPVELLDEPTAFLDDVAAQRVRQLLLQRSQERLVLVATHDPKLMAHATEVIQPQLIQRSALAGAALST